MNKVLDTCLDFLIIGLLMTACFFGGYIYSMRGSLFPPAPVEPANSAQVPAAAVVINDLLKNPEALFNAQQQILPLCASLPCSNFSWSKKSIPAF